MSVLMRAGDLSGRPVITLAGERVAEIKDVVFDRGQGRVAGFTLNNPGLFSRSRKDALRWSGVHGLGGEALMIADETSLVDRGEVVAKADLKGGDVLAGQVLTDAGDELGTIVDVIVAILPEQADLVGYEIEAGPNLPNKGRRVLIPLPSALAVSGEKLIVPAAVTEFVSEDLAGFGAAVEAFRAKLDTGSAQPTADGEGRASATGEES